MFDALSPTVHCNIPWLGISLFHFFLTVQWQISYLQSLGCTVTPTSRLHASRLIEQYKSL